MIVTLLNEGLALVSSNAFITAWAWIATADADALLSVFDVAGALDLEAFGANLCIPPIHGAARDALAYARTILALELSSSQSNPAVVVPAADEPGPDRGRIVSVGNFDVGPLAAALDDRATMAPLTGWRLADMISLCARVAAIEFVVAAQAIDLRAQYRRSW
jgi:histidine ammonia-lyase